MIQIRFSMNDISWKITNNLEGNTSTNKNGARTYLTALVLDLDVK